MCNNCATLLPELSLGPTCLGRSATLAAPRHVLPFRYNISFQDVCVFLVSIYQPVTQTRIYLWLMFLTLDLYAACFSHSHTLQRQEAKITLEQTDICVDQGNQHHTSVQQDSAANKCTLLS